MISAFIGLDMAWRREPNVVMAVVSPETPLERYSEDPRERSQTVLGLEVWPTQGVRVVPPESEQRRNGIRIPEPGCLRVWRVSEASPICTGLAAHADHFASRSKCRHLPLTLTYGTQGMMTFKAHWNF